jgi:spore germination cell wall hydrolase CwlJ-like protein
MLLVDPATCLAVAIYFEARGEMAINQIKVAEVIMNRVESKRYPNTICEVVKQSRQFSFLNGEPELSINKKGKAWATAQHLAAIAIENGGKTTDACHYAHTDVRNSWTKKLKGKKHGNHVFYEGGC